MNTQPLSTLPTHRLPSLAAALPLPTVAGRPPSTADFSLLLDEFEPIGLTQMDAVALLDRTDTKYVMQSIDLPGVAIAEVTQEGINRNSDFVRQMRAMAIHASSFSKYCIGTALLYPAIKHNNFKNQLRLVGKLMGGDTYVYRTH